MTDSLPEAGLGKDESGAHFAPEGNGCYRRLLTVSKGEWGLQNYCCCRLHVRLKMDKVSESSFYSAFPVWMVLRVNNNSWREISLHKRILDNKYRTN